MTDQTCMIGGCPNRLYAPAGTQAVCKDHFLNFLTWRRRRGPQMFLKYAAMTMEQRDIITAEWQKSVRVEEVPTSPSPPR